MQTRKMSPTEITEAVATHTMSLGALVSHCLAARVTLARELDGYQIVESLDQAELVLNAGKLPRWEYHPTSEQMQARNSSEPIYMYLYWRRNRYSRKYESPRGNRKTYVGAKPARQSLARSLDANLTAWEELQRRVGHHTYELDRILNGLEGAAVRAAALTTDMDHTITDFTAEVTP